MLTARIYRTTEALGGGHLALALAAIEKMASSEGVRYDGFEGWRGTPVGGFIERHLPDQAA